MDGCLGSMVKVVIHLILFLIGGILGYMYVTGHFDARIIQWEMSRIHGMDVTDAMKRVDAKATLEAAVTDLDSVSEKFVLWTGTLRESRILGGPIRRLEVRGISGPEFVAYHDRPLDVLNIGDRIEILGYATRIETQSENQEDYGWPQVVAIRVKEVNPVVRSIQATPTTSSPRTQEGMVGRASPRVVRFEASPSPAPPR